MVLNTIIQQIKSVFKAKTTANFVLEIVSKMGIIAVDYYTNLLLKGVIMTDLALFQTVPVATSGRQMSATQAFIVNVDALNDSEKIRIRTAWDALAPNTQRSYEKGLALCRAWLTEKGIPEDQLTDELLSVFMLTESKRHPRTKTGEVKTGEVVKPGSVAVMFAAVKWYFCESQKRET